MVTRLQKVNAMKAEWLQSLSDEELDAIADKDLDLSGFTDQELAAVVNNTASPELIRRVELTRQPQKVAP